MSIDLYQVSTSKAVKYLVEMEELEKLSLQVTRQLGLEISKEGYREANIIAWLLELYVRKVGEIEVLKRWKNGLNRLRTNSS